MPTRTERFNSLATKLGVTQIYQVDTKDGKSNPATKEIWVNVAGLEETPAFYCGLHELGHLVTFATHKVFGYDRIRDGTDSAQLSNEAAASRWALDNSGEIPDSDAYQSLYLGLQSYLNGFRRSYGDGEVSKAMISLMIVTDPNLKGKGLSADSMCSIPADFQSLYDECKSKGASSKLSLDDVYPGLSRGDKTCFKGA